MIPLSDSPFMTAAEKQRVLREWTSFLRVLAEHYDDKNRCLSSFGDALYRHLHSHCGFVDRSSRSGFFREYFEDGDRTLRFIRQFDIAGNRLGYASTFATTAWLNGDYADLNRTMRGLASRFIPQIKTAAQAAQREAGVTGARRPASRHGSRISG